MTLHGKTGKRILYSAVLALSAGLILQAGGCSGGGSSGGGGASDNTTIGQATRTKIASESLNAGSESGDYTFDWPSGAGSVMMIVDGGSGAQDMDISYVEDPDGTVLVTSDYNDTDPIGGNGAQFQGYSTASLMLPNTPDYPFVEGEYKFRAISFGKSVNANIYTVVNNRNADGGTTDINVVLVSMPEVSSVDDSAMAILLNEFKRVYEANGFALGTVHFFSLNDDNLTVIDSSDGSGNGQPDKMDQLLRKSSDTGNDYPTLFFVKSLMESEGGVLGISGGIPGPLTLQGTEHSGVIINTFGGLHSLTEAELIMQAQTMAHELGHYLGLFHTTESSGTQFDPIADTPECRGTADVSAEQCRNRDGSNLMFWVAPAGDSGMSQDYLSPSQRYIFSRAPVFQ